MAPRHLPKKLLCVALVGSSILAVIYYTNGISNSPFKLKPKPDKGNSLEIGIGGKQQNRPSFFKDKGLFCRNDSTKVHLIIECRFIVA